VFEKRSYLHEIDDLIMSRQIQSKKIQTPQNSEKLFLAKCFVEQQLEQIQKSSTQISLKGNTDDGSVLFRVVKTKEIAAVAIDGNLYVFAKPLTNFKGLPLDAKMVQLSSIRKTDGVMRCAKCKSWVNDADVAKCPCGGYLQKRKRFHPKDEVTESLDGEYLEIQFALEDARISARMDSKPRHKVPTATGVITSSMAGMSSVETITTICTGFLTTVSVKSADGKKILDEDEKYSFFEKMGVDVKSIQSDEIQEYAKMDVQKRAKIAVDSWNNNHTPMGNIDENFFGQTKNQRHSPQKIHKSHPKTTTARDTINKRTTKCSACGNKTSALVESKCSDCFLKVKN